MLDILSHHVVTEVEKRFSWDQTPNYIGEPRSCSFGRSGQVIRGFSLHTLNSSSYKALIIETSYSSVSHCDQRAPTTDQRSVTSIYIYPYDPLANRRGRVRVELAYHRLGALLERPGHAIHR